MKTYDWALDLLPLALPPDLPPVILIDYLGFERVDSKWVVERGRVDG